MKPGDFVTDLKGKDPRTIHKVDRKFSILFIEGVDPYPVAINEHFLRFWREIEIPEALDKGFDILTTEGGCTQGQTLELMLFAYRVGSSQDINVSVSNESIKVFEDFKNGRTVNQVDMVQAVSEFLILWRTYCDR